MDDRSQSIFARFRQFLPARRLLVTAGGLLAAVFLLFLSVPHHPGLPVGPPTPLKQSIPAGEVAPFVGTASIGGDAKLVDALKSPSLLAESYEAGRSASAGFLVGPRVAYSAELSVVTKEFARSRSSLEEILERHRGYVAKLRMVGEPSGSVLSATLRVPSSEYRSTLSELKTIGLLEREEESADEITQHHGELEARLLNAQNEERRIVQMLQNRSEKFSNSGDLERQISLLRTEIGQMEAERSGYSSRVSFANILYSLREERITPAETIGAKLRAAAMTGFSDASESISAILLFLAIRGPLLALWAALLYLPVRFFWRRRSQWSLKQAEVPKTV